MPSETTYRWLVIRVPSSGPPAVVSPRVIYQSEDEALAQIREIESGHRKTHHTYLDTFRYSGDLQRALADAGINY